MPRPTRARRRKRAIDEAVAQTYLGYLNTGQLVPPPAMDRGEAFMRFSRWYPAAIETVERLWAEHGERITKQHIRRRANTRPFGWWTFETTEFRVFFDGDLTPKEGHDYEWPKNYFGCPPQFEARMVTAGVSYRGVVNCGWDNDETANYLLQFESEADYLMRHGLQE